MLSLKYIPRAPLSEFVQCLWYCEGAPQAHSKEKLLPNGEFSIVFNLIDEPFRIYDVDNLSRFSTHGVAVLSGARSNCFAIDTSQQDRVAGIQFRAGGAFPFLRMPASEAEGSSIDLDDIWPGKAGEIRERILAASSPEATLTALECCLVERLARPLELHPAVVYALHQFQRSIDSCKVGEISEYIGLSSRRFIELFRRQVGLTPKVFSRVRRFQQVLQTVHLGQEMDWVRVALECGYYDQAHFIHEFQAFSGLTPCGYAAAATSHLNHVPMSDRDISSRSISYNPKDSSLRENCD